MTFTRNEGGAQRATGIVGTRTRVATVTDVPWSSADPIPCGSSAVEIPETDDSRITALDAAAP